MQTAVNFLIQALGEYFPNEIGGIHYLVETTKKMEAEQMGWNNTFSKKVSDDEKVEITLDIKSLVGEVDVEKKARDYSNEIPYSDFDEGKIYGKHIGFIDGYNTCLGDNKDKRFSLKDLQWAIHEARYHHEHSVEEIIQSLTQPKDL